MPKSNRDSIIPEIFVHDGPGALPPSTICAAITTRLPVMWAVKTWPKQKNPVTSTSPATTLRIANNARWFAPSGFADTIGPCRRRCRRDTDRLSAPCPQLWSHQAKPHREQNQDGGRSLREDHISQAGWRIHALRRHLRQPRCHPKKKDARNQ